MRSLTLELLGLILVICIFHTKKKKSTSKSFEETFVNIPLKFSASPVCWWLTLAFSSALQFIHPLLNYFVLTRAPLATCFVSLDQPNKFRAYLLIQLFSYVLRSPFLYLRVSLCFSQSYMLCFLIPS